MLPVQLSYFSYIGITDSLALRLCSASPIS
jgi:hypothetical protein